MDFKIFANNLARLGVNFSNLTITKEYTKNMYTELMNFGFNDHDFQCAVDEIMNRETQLFNLPTKALFIKYSNKKPIDDERMAEIEASRIIEASKLEKPVIFDNPTTNAVLIECGGIGKIYFDLFDQFNDNRKQQHWIEKDLQRKWINCKISNKQSYFPSYPKSYLGSSEPELIGDPNKCRELIAQGNLSKLVIDKSRNQCLAIGELIKDKSINNPKND